MNLRVLVMRNDDIVLVTGAGGFIGGHLVEHLRSACGFSRIRAVDIKPIDEWYQLHDGVENLTLDMSKREAAFKAV